MANDYFSKENRSVGVYTRKPGTSSGEDSIKDLTPEQQSMLKTIAAKLSQEKDVGKLKQALQAIEARAPQADEKSRSLFEAQKQLLQHRIEELK